MHKISSFLTTACLVGLHSFAHAQSGSFSDITTGTMATGYSHLPFSNGSLFLTGGIAPGLEGNLYFRTYNGQGMGNASSWQYPFIIKGASGNVGIGTTEPGAKLHVAGQMLSTGPLGGYGFQDRNPSAPTTWWWYSNGNMARLWNPANNDVLQVSMTGDMGVGGRIAPGYKLSVSGKVLAEEVRVEQTANWPDYVFAPAYRLRPLGEVAQYLGANHHLPGVPSAAEVKAGGIALGAMNATLLEKVEELTLYAIEQQKQNQRLAEQVQALQTTAAALSQQVKLLQQQGAK